MNPPTAPLNPLVAIYEYERRDAVGAAIALLTAHLDRGRTELDCPAVVLLLDDTIEELRRAAVALLLDDTIEELRRA